MKKKDLLFGTTYGILAALSFAVMATFVKLSSQVNLEILVFFRSIISLAFLTPLLFLKKIPIKTKKVKLHILRSVFGVLGVYAYFYAIKKLPLVNAILLANTAPLFMPLIILIWLKHKSPLMRIFGVFLGFIGVAIILEPRFDFPLIPSLIGISVGLCIAISMISVRLLSKTDQTESILFYFFFYSSLISFFPMIFRWEAFESKMWYYIFLVGLLTILFQYFTTKVYTYLPATKAACFMFLSVIFGGVLGWLVFESIPRLAVIMGSLFVIIGGMIVVLDKKKATPFLKNPK